MLKTKTRKAAAKRFKISGSGHISRKKAGTRHFLAKKSPDRRRVLKKRTSVDPADLKPLLRCLPNR